MTVLKPSWAVYWSFYKKNLIVALPLTLGILTVAIINVSRNDSFDEIGGIPALIGILVAGLALGFLGMALYFGVTEVRLEPGRVLTRNWIGVRKSIDVGQIGEVFQVASAKPFNGASSPHLFLVGHDGRKLYRMRGEFYSVDSMNLLAHHGVSQGAPYNPWPNQMSTKELAQARPGLVSLYEARPLMMGLIIAGGIIVFAIVAAVILVQFA